jgi:serine/threonine protein kinase
LLDNLGTLKICDFGIAITEESEKISSKNKQGTPQYMAPEMWENGNTITGAVDIWAAGCVLYAMVYGQLPFAALDKNCLKELAVANKGSKKLPKWNDPAEYKDNQFPNLKITIRDTDVILNQERYSAALNDLLWRMLAKNPEERLTLG